VTEELATEFRNSNAELIPPIDDEHLLDRIQTNAELFAKGEKNILDWNTKKQDVILDMAHDIAKLIEREHPKYLGYAIHNIASIICETLRDHHFVDENVYRWVRKLLSPLGYTDSKYANLEKEEEKKKLFTYYSKEELKKLFATMTVEEQIKFRNQVLVTDTERKRQIHLCKDNMNEIFAAEGINPDTYSNTTNKFNPEYTEAEDDDDDDFEPPEELKQNHLFHDTILSAARKYFRVAKILEGVAEHISLYPPQTAEMDKRLAEKGELIDDYLAEMQIHFWSGFNDDKAVATWDEWCDYLEEKAQHGNNAAASKYATPTGEFVEQKRKDGTTFLQALERRVTNEHLKKKMPEQVKELKKSWIFEFCFSALRDWFHNQYYILGEEAPEKIAQIEKAYLATQRQDIQC
jgi:hypothetical protein